MPAVNNNCRLDQAGLRGPPARGACASSAMRIKSGRASSRAGRARRASRRDWGHVGLYSTWMQLRKAWDGGAVAAD
jgi:hypothetical protein